MEMSCNKKRHFEDQDNEKVCMQKTFLPSNENKETVKEQSFLS